MHLAAALNSQEKAFTSREKSVECAVWSSHVNIMGTIQLVEACACYPCARDELHLISISDLHLAAALNSHEKATTPHDKNESNVLSGFPT
jgi:hypothetical protein